MSEQNTKKNVNLTFKDQVFSFEEADLAVDPIGFLVVTSEAKRHFFDLEHVVYYNYEVEQEFKPSGDHLTLIQ